MAKQFAHKDTKELVEEAVIKNKENKLNMSDFTNTWQGRINFINTEKSFIAHEMSVTKKGEYAIKVR